MDSESFDFIKILIFFSKKKEGLYFMTKKSWIKTELTDV